MNMKKKTIFNFFAFIGIGANGALNIVRSGEQTMHKLSYM